MKREALAFFRILPAGAADVGADVSREELRDAGLGQWSMSCTERDDLRGLLRDEYDEPVCLDDREPGHGETYVELRLRTA